MEKKIIHNFNEKQEEYIDGNNLPVWISPKYVETKEKVIEMIDSGKYGLKDNDFWILMNKTSKGDKVAYTGLIISHNGCLKINDALDRELKFKPSCVKENQNGYENSLVFTYSNDEQGIYETGEISVSNYKQKNGRYPYAMGYKRLFDRVVLKNSKLAYAGVYSDSEADEFQDKNEETSKPVSENTNTKSHISLLKEYEEYLLKSDTNRDNLYLHFKVKDYTELTDAQLTEAIKIMAIKIDKKEKMKEVF